MRFIGEKGSVYVVSQNVVTDPASIKTTKIGEDGIRLYDAKNSHHGNFLDCVRSREQPSAPVEIAHRSASICQLGAISSVLGRKLRWNPKTERFAGDPEADKMIEASKASGVKGSWSSNVM